MIKSPATALSPTQFLRTAAQRERWIPTPFAWQPKYATPTRTDACPKQPLLDGRTAVSFPDPPMVVVSDADCWLCGASTAGWGQPLTGVRKDQFSEADRARAPWSSSLCAGCAWAFAYKELRLYSYLATAEGFTILTRAAWRDRLRQPPPGRYLAVLNVSGQRWNHFKAPWGDGSHWRVLLEDTVVPVGAAFGPLLGAVEALLRAGFSKTAIGSGQYQGRLPRGLDVTWWAAQEDQVRPWRHTPLGDLALYVAQKDDGGSLAEPPSDDVAPHATPPRWQQATWLGSLE
jgi:hypothetical protein